MDAKWPCTILRVVNEPRALARGWLRWRVTRRWRSGLVRALRIRAWVSRCTPRRARVGALLAICGCTWGQQDPAARRQTGESREPQEPPQVVQTESATASASAEEAASQTILGYIERVDQAEKLAKDREVARAHEAAHVRPAAGLRPSPSTRPADTASIEVIPEEAGQPPTDAPTEPEEVLHAPSSDLEPPTLDRVALRAASSLEAVAPDPLAPAVNVPAYARAGPTSLREFLDQLPAADESSFREQLDRRMLWVIAGDYERARTPLKLVTAEQQQLAARFVEAWIVIREWHMGDQPGAANAAGAELRELQLALRHLSDLSLPKLEICSAVRGFGQYDAIQPPRLPAGVESQFVLYCEVSNFVSQHQDNGDYVSSFDMTTTILNQAGDTILEIKDTDILDRCRNQRQDCFIPRLVRLPASLPPGQYVAKVGVVDKLGQKMAENRATFELVARP